MQGKVRQSDADLGMAGDYDRQEIEKDSDNEDGLFKYTITAYGADYPVDSLVKRIQDQHIIIPRITEAGTENTEVAGFQRELVWKKPRQDKFVESLLLGLPVPGIFLVKEESGKLLVLDGQQRLLTLSAFCNSGTNGGEYRLKHVQDQFKGLCYSELDVVDRRKLDDSIIHATIVRQDSPTDGLSSIYLIFERLNSGGVNLEPQEIRMALYHGKFAQLLLKLNENRAWRRLYGAKDNRLKDVELILRFFCFRFRADEYSPPMKAFLNAQMENYRNVPEKERAELTKEFERTVEVLEQILGPGAFKPQKRMNTALAESLMTGVASRLKSGEITDGSQFKQRYSKLLEDSSFNTAISVGTSTRAKVEIRLKLATDAFADLA